MSSPRFSRPLALLASLTTMLAAGIAGCGATARHSATTPVATTATAASSTPGPGGSTGQTGSISVPADDVAVVDGTPITDATFQHWLQVTTYSNAAGRGGAAVIPDPPSFTHCIAEARRIGKLAHEATQKLRTDCAVLLNSDAGQTMDFLIKNVWLEQAARQAHFDPSPSEVRATFAAQKRKEFKNAAAFKAFLTATRQTTTDVLLRIRINQILSALAKRAGGAKTLETELEFSYKPKTRCAAEYALSDCVNAPAAASG